jgi:hypothetical protein
VNDDGTVDDADLLTVPRLETDDADDADADDE